MLARSWLSISRELRTATLPDLESSPEPPMSVQTKPLHLDLSPGSRISSAAAPVVSPLFKGQVLFTSASSSDPGTPVFRDAFSTSPGCKGELRIAGRLSKKPEGKLYIAAELDADAVSWSPSTAVLGRVLVSLIQKLLPMEFTYSLGDVKKGEKPHIAFPALQIMDDVVVGGGAGIYGKMEEDEGERKRRQGNGWREIERGLERDTVLMLRQRMYYADFARWAASGLPLVGEFPLGIFWGRSPLKFVLYSKLPEAEGGKREDLVVVRIVNKEHTDSSRGDEARD
ncbi:hypothetical protein TeGR_g6648 [Tetraparma gracilis]|uniref:Domain of unknown function at the cortex 1 domain-containing protein n=1 Tax=Tetraparma gracilis TaxID=2962635 RepID=A0ABQ6M5Z8_9STRA|nr:hypothetical protein TeGR_g6648 [Tetraparma gracilis]